MPGRIIAIGDIHGCLQALETLVRTVDLQPQDTLITLGDYIDRGPDSRGVLDYLIALSKRFQLVPILGNHDEMLLNILGGQWYMINDWFTFGGLTTLESYGCETPEKIPQEHINFLKNCVPWYETDRHFFVHASYLPKKPLKKQPTETLRWQRIDSKPPGPHRSGKIAVTGHTSQRSGEVLNLGYLYCIDTFCYGDGWLTALDVMQGTLWQANKAGELRSK